MTVKSETFQQLLDVAFNKAASNTAFANDRHQDIAKTWFETGYIQSCTESVQDSEYLIARIATLALQWNHYIISYPEDNEYQGEQGMIKYIQTHYSV